MTEDTDSKAPRDDDGDDPGTSRAMPIDAVLAPLGLFMQHKLAGTGLLMAATVAALVWANSPWEESYHHLLHLKLKLSLGDFVFKKSLHHLINDGLMGIFFFLVGLEIKRELLVGELSSKRKAALPAMAAIGGMAVPALLYVAINPTLPERVGWGIPMATDIAFALGMLAILGSRCPPGLKIFLTALAIVDDIGAVLVIAIFYTEQIAMTSLGFGVLGVVASMLMSRLGVRSAVAYFVVGTLVWLAFLQSGVHATIAALLMAFTIPARTRIDGARLVQRLQLTLARLRGGKGSGTGLNTHDEELALAEIARTHEAATAPLQSLEHALAPVVTLGVLPIFALANAGVSLAGADASAVLEGIGLGIIVGLVVGKPAGILAFTVAAVRLGWADLPKGVTWRQVLGAGALGGIGFTMALFIADLAFESAADLDTAKLAILGGSLVAGVIGLALLATGPTPTNLTTRPDAVGTVHRADPAGSAASLRPGPGPLCGTQARTRPPRGRNQARRGAFD